MFQNLAKVLVPLLGFFLPVNIILQCENFFLRYFLMKADSKLSKLLGLRYQWGMQGKGEGDVEASN